MDNLRETPLHRAALTGKTENAVALIDSGADANARIADGRTPFFLAYNKALMETAAAIESKGGRR